MAFHPPITIAEAITNIRSGHYVLPAIQREFVWDEDQICRLFDSVMRGYPIGAFLSWEVQPKTAAEFKFYGFLRDYHEKDQPYCPIADVPPDRAVVGILDGQQRLTALNIGLRGSFARRLKNKRWDNPNAFPKKLLYINVLGPAPENELGMEYDFRMFAEPPAVKKDDPPTHWFPFHRIYEIQKASVLAKESAALGMLLGDHVDFATDLLGDAVDAIHNTQSLNFYKEEDQSVEKILDIFIRVNSGGTKLGYSDLLLSIATAQWTTLDAREELRTLVREVNGTGQSFAFSRDVILKCGLVLTGVTDIGFKVKNFNHANMAKLEDDWPEIRQSILLAVQLLSDFGLADGNLTADSVLVPVAHYVHRRKLASTNYRTATAFAGDRRVLRRWIIRSQVKRGIWGSGLDTLLRALRDVVDEHGAAEFPAPAIEARMKALGKSLDFVPEEVEDLLLAKYRGEGTFALLALLFPHVDTRNIHHVDHVFPKSLLGIKVLKEQGFDSEAAADLADIKDQLPNLELLPGPENEEKSNTLPLAWAQAKLPGSMYTAYLKDNALPELPADAHEFKTWFQDRRELLRARLLDILKADDVAPDSDD